MTTMSMIVVKAAFDSDAGVWFVESSDLPGLNVEPFSKTCTVATAGHTVSACQTRQVGEEFRTRRPGADHPKYLFSRCHCRFTSLGRLCGGTGSISREP